MDKAEDSGERVLSLEEGLPLLKRQLWKHNSILRRNAALQRLGLRMEEPEEVIARIRRHFPDQDAKRLGGLNPNRLAFWLEKALAAEEAGTVPAELPKTEDTMGSNAKGVCLRDAKFLEWYNTLGSDTYHSPVTIWKRWDGLKQDERAMICPTSPMKVSKLAVAQAIKRARVKTPATAKRKKKTRRKG